MGFSFFDERRHIYSYKYKVELLNDNSADHFTAVLYGSANFLPSHMGVKMMHHSQPLTQKDLMIFRYAFSLTILPSRFLLSSLADL